MALSFGEKLASFLEGQGIQGDHLQRCQGHNLLKVLPLQDQSLSTLIRRWNDNQLHECSLQCTQRRDQWTIHGLQRDQRNANWPPQLNTEADKILPRSDHWLESHTWVAHEVGARAFLSQRSDSCWQTIGLHLIRVPIRLPHADGPALYRLLQQIANQITNTAPVFGSFHQHSYQLVQCNLRAVFFGK